MASISKSTGKMNATKSTLVNSIAAQSDQSLCLSLEYSMTPMLLTEQNLEFLSLIGGCTGTSKSTLVKMPHFWKSHVVAHLSLYSWQSATSLQGYLLAYQSNSADAQVDLHLCFSHAAELDLQAMLINPTRLTNMPTHFTIVTNNKSSKINIACNQNRLV